MSTAATENGGRPVVTLAWGLKMALAYGGVSAADMAETLGVSRQTLSRWMAGKGAAPRRAFILQWAMRTGIDPDWLETLPRLDSNQEPAGYRFAPGQRHRRHASRARCVSKRIISVLDATMREPRTLTGRWSEAIGAFVTALRAARRSAGTIRLYRHYLHQLAYATRTDPFVVSTADLRGWLAGTGWAPETAKTARTAVRAFYRWAYGEAHISYNPAARLDPVRVPAGVPRPAPEAVVAAAVTDPDERIARMAQLAAYAGLRAGEIARVHARDVTDDLGGLSLRVTGKGGRVRTVPIVAHQLAGWLAGLDGYAFPSVAANGQVRAHLSAGHVSRLLAAALPEGWTAHTLRHRCATAAYAGTRDLLAVGAVLGHAKPETTRRYVQLPDDAIRAAMRSAA